MIKKQLIETNDYNTYIKALDCLKAADIDFRIKVKFPNGGRAIPTKQTKQTMAAVGGNHSSYLNKSYCIFVKPKDFDNAVYAVNKRG